MTGLLPMNDSRALRESNHFGPSEVLWTDLCPSKIHKAKSASKVHPFKQVVLKGSYFKTMALG